MNRDFEEMFDLIALPQDARETTTASTPALIASFIHFAIGAGVAVSFFLAGLALTLFCIGFLVWIAGALLLLPISLTGTTAALTALSTGPKRSPEFLLALLAFLLNFALLLLSLGFLVCLLGLAR